MEVTSGKIRRVFRNEEQIKSLLEQQTVSGISVKAFCKSKGLAYGSFQNWRKKYVQPELPTGFTKINVVPSSSPGLFAEVNNIKLYQPVSAAYLKELL